VNRRDHEQTTPPEPLTGLQGEGGTGRRQGRSNHRPAGQRRRDWSLLKLDARDSPKHLLIAKLVDEQRRAHDGRPCPGVSGERDSYDRRGSRSLCRTRGTQAAGSCASIPGEHPATVSEGYEMGIANHLPVGKSP